MFNNQRLNVEPSTYHCMDHHAIPNISQVVDAPLKKKQWATWIFIAVAGMVYNHHSPSVVNYKPNAKPPAGDLLTDLIIYLPA